jgi:hypothetical protein
MKCVSKTSVLGTVQNNIFQSVKLFIKPSVKMSDVSGTVSQLKSQKRMAFETLLGKNKKSKTIYFRQFELGNRPAIYSPAAFFARASNP